MHLSENYCSTSVIPSQLCCCCMKEGAHNYLNQNDIYDEMLRETFNIQLLSNIKETSSRAICDSCISQLQDATSFKQMVLNNERNFLQYLDQLKVETSTNIKMEDVSLIPCDVADSRLSFDEDDEILANIKSELTKENAVLDTSLRRKRTTVRKRERDKVSSVAKSDHKKREWFKLIERRGNGPILRENSLQILSNSTACVFQWNKSRYRCFCCDQPYSDLEKLKSHTHTKHTIEEIKKKIIAQQNRLVKVEISALYCKICGNKFDELAALKEHLTVDHNLTFDSCEDLLVPFKIEPQLQCQICKENFRVFRHLNIHMNKHYQKHVCHICGAGFSNLVFLNLHKTRTHKPFTCKLCNLVFLNKTEQKNHDISIHNVKFERKLRFPCPYCQERFFQENFRIKHLIDAHGMEKPEHKCSICSKAFLTRSLCNNHVKNVHMKEKNHECDVCHHLFYTKSDVSRHRVTHTGEKKFTCSYCNNPFATKDSLRRHIKRTHNVGGN